MVLYLIYEYFLLARPEDDALNPIVLISNWIIVDGPILLIFLIANVIWTALIIRAVRVCKNWRPLTWWGITLFAWSVTLFMNGLAFDFLRLEIGK